MAGVVPMVPPRAGSMTGKLEVETSRFVTFNELCAHVPEINDFFVALDKKGLKYLLVDSHGKIVLEMAVETAPYVWQTYEAARGGFAYKLAFDFGRRLPRMGLKKVLGLENCIVNIRNQDFPRALTVDLVQNAVTFVHDSLWAARGKKLSPEARRVLQILRWLVEDKKFKIAAEGGEGYYRELTAQMDGK